MNRRYRFEVYSVPCADVESHTVYDFRSADLEVEIGHTDEEQAFDTALQFSVDLLTQGRIQLTAIVDCQSKDVEYVYRNARHGGITRCHDRYILNRLLKEHGDFPANGRIKRA